MEDGAGEAQCPREGQVRTIDRERMFADHLTGIEQFEAEPLEGRRYPACQYKLLHRTSILCPSWGLIFLRQATTRYYEATAVIDEEMAAGRMPERPLDRSRLHPAPRPNAA